MKISGEGTSLEDIFNGGNGGTQFLVTNTLGGLIADWFNGSINTTGSILYLSDMEFLQEVPLAQSDYACVSLHGMAQGKLTNFQVANPSGTIMHCYGIHFDNHIGTDDAGGPIELDQVQTGGFDCGLNCRIDHWATKQLGICKCNIAMDWSVCAYNNLNNVHIFQCNTILRLYAGYTGHGIGTINGLYLEDITNSSTNPVWYVDAAFQGMVEITNVNAVACSAATLWYITNSDKGQSKIWFDNVQTISSTAFPDPVTPTYNKGTVFTNNYSQVVYVHAVFETCTGIEINGVAITPGTYLDCYLRPSDTIKITASDCQWKWLGFGAESCETCKRR